VFRCFVDSVEYSVEGFGVLATSTKFTLKLQAGLCDVKGICEGDCSAAGDGSHDEVEVEVV